MRWSMYRIARGVPRYGLDLRERDLPQETGQEHALNFSKGCYIGQEIVERIRARGNVHRTLIGFAVEGAPPQPGTKVRANDKEWARSRAPRACRMGARSRWATCAKKSLQPGTAVQIGEQRATVTACPSSFERTRKNLCQKKKRNRNL